MWRQQFKYTNIRYIIGCIFVLGVILVIGSLIRFQDNPVWYGYVVGEDRKIYMLNLETGQLEWISRVMEKIWQPTEIEINREESILYIASGSALPRNDYIPLIAVSLNPTADIVFETPRYDDSGVADGAYSVRLNPDGKSLYVNYLYGDQHTTILDPLTGEVMGGANRPILKRREFSPDGRMTASIVPGGTRVRESGIREYPGLVAVLNLETGEGFNTYLEGSQGLYPPWGFSEEHFVYIRFQPRQGIYRLEVYDRESGEVLAVYDEFSEEVKGAPNQRYATSILVATM